VPAPTGQLKASRYFGVLGLILLALYGLVFFTGDKKAHPKLGLDLQGGTSMTLTALSPDGGRPSEEQLKQARQIINDRVDLTGVSEPTVTIEGSDKIVVQVAGAVDADELRKLVAPAQLRFRQVVSTYQDKSGETEESASPSASGSASASASGSASASAKPSGSAKASGSASASPSTGASASASGSAAAGTNPSASTNPAVEKLRQQVIAKLGQSWEFAQQVQDPSQIDAQSAMFFEPFTKLTPEEVAVLPADIQYKIPQVSCAKLNQRPGGAVAKAEEKVVACGEETGAPTKYLLDKARVLGEDVASASFNNDPTNGWVVNLKFKSAGQDKWTKLTRDVYGDGSGQGDNRRVAIVLDNKVVSAPTIQGVIAGDAQIYGAFSRKDVDTLARQLKYGSLPLSFRTESVDTVSATLGLASLRAGILAGLIGVALVIVYCFIYYRALGLVVVASLAVSAGTVFASLILLGRSIGYALTLAGVAGFIVAIGITADSFVVFFERLKDEVKDGRTVRSAVPRAWTRARRTILSADTVLMLGAAVLYLLAVGGVKGFAFTLGLSTIIDLMVVFLFTHPLVALLSRSNAFTSPRFSGLGNLRSDRSVATAAAGGRVGSLRTKES
jgi:preprotein translocase subunit SecD